ncbi:MAG TPA: hypothetical protein VKJ47_16450 [Candidatus Binatia bacterium]|nr:hypothetical protein [Candidatus Binatia bacterium]
MRIDLAKDRNRPTGGVAIDVLLVMRGVLVVRVVVMARVMPVVNGLILDRWGEEKPGVNMRMVAAGMGVVERSDLRLEKKVQERRKNR